jgi:hypothetical protein
MYYSLNKAIGAICYLILNIILRYIVEIEGKLLKAEKIQNSNFFQRFGR